jgi:hypothetical protein
MMGSASTASTSTSSLTPLSSAEKVGLIEMMNDMMIAVEGLELGICLIDSRGYSSAWGSKKGGKEEAGLEGRIYTRGGFFQS